MISPRIRRLAKLLFVAFVLAYLSALGYVYAKQTSLLFPAPQQVFTPPAAAGLEIFDITTADGQTLNVWYAPPAPGAPLVVMFHGNRGRSERHVAIAQSIRAAGFGFYLATFRGYPPSSGEPSQDGLYADGLALFDDAKARCACDIILLGHSLGSGVAVHTAALREAKAVLLVSPYSSITDVAAGRYWFMPVQQLIKNRFPSLDYIGQVTEPLMVLHGDADVTVPYRFGKRLYDAANQPKELKTFKGVGHELMWNIDAGQWVAKLVQDAAAAEANPAQ